MILNTKQFVEACRTILTAIDNKNISLYSETLELRASKSELRLNVTNREYYVTVKFSLPEELKEDFIAAVNAELFLKLVSKITSPTIEILKEDNNLKIKGNGNYKLPIIFNNDVMLELPKIEIKNVTNTFKISNKILQSILFYNSKELQRGTAVKPVQKYFYIDDKGCITFTSGACVNNFTLPQTIKILLSEKVVKLFKLFKDVDDVNFSIGIDPLNQSVTQTKVRFESGNVDLVAILSDSSLVSSVPVDAIRGMATKNYSYSAVVNREELLQVINRLMLFNSDKNYGTLEFTNGKIKIYDWSSDNTEEIVTTNDCPTLTSYKAIVNFSNLNLILSGNEDDYVTICFGDQKALVIKKQTISDIIPELKVQP